MLLLFNRAYAEEEGGKWNQGTSSEAAEEPDHELLYWIGPFV